MPSTLEAASKTMARIARLNNCSAESVAAAHRRTVSTVLKLDRYFRHNETTPIEPMPASSTARTGAVCCNACRIERFGIVSGDGTGPIFTPSFDVPAEAGFTKLGVVARGF